MHQSQKNKNIRLLQCYSVSRHYSTAAGEDGWCNSDSASDGLRRGAWRLKGTLPVASAARMVAEGSLTTPRNCCSGSWSWNWSWSWELLRSSGGAEEASRRSGEASELIWRPEMGREALTTSRVFAEKTADGRSSGVRGEVRRRLEEHPRVSAELGAKFGRI